MATKVKYYYSLGVGEGWSYSHLDKDYWESVSEDPVWLCRDNMSLPALFKVLLSDNTKDLTICEGKCFCQLKTDTCQKEWHYAMAAVWYNYWAVSSLAKLTSTERNLKFCQAENDNKGPPIHGMNAVAQRLNNVTNFIAIKLNITFNWFSTIFFSDTITKKM